MNTPQQLHTPVLFDAVLTQLSPKAGEHYLDLTAGYGGHARGVIACIGAAKLATLVDRDQSAVASLDDLKEQGARLLHLDFLAAAKKLQAEAAQFDMILLDLGVSSPQLDQAERGFSFQRDGALDMRMDQAQSLTASEIVNRFSAPELTRLIVRYGEETPRLAEKIARAIVTARRVRRLATTGELADLIEKAKPRRGKTHPATQTFQAIRIAVNDELGQLERTLPILPKLLKNGGRLAVISFHSLEDRIVKRYFTEQRDAGLEAELAILTRHPLTENNDNNPRARSAKLRAAVKIK
jgi:16S rRNA (cytosine1402-N4)-methyltransferase